MVSPKVSKWIESFSRKFTSQEPKIDKQLAAKGASDDNGISKSIEELNLSSENDSSETSASVTSASDISAQSERIKTAAMTADGLAREQILESNTEASPADAQTPSYNHQEHKLGSDPLYVLQEGEYPDDDDQFIECTRVETPMHDVIKLKYDILFQRDQAREAKKETAEVKARIEKQCQEFLLGRQERAKQNVHVKPNPPRLHEIKRHYLYKSTLDRLRECTVHLILRRARDHLSFDDYKGSELHANQALINAALLDYLPLSAWCRFHIGKAQFHQGRYDEALETFKKARRAKGLYVTGWEFDEWVVETKSAIERRGKRAAKPAELEPVKRSLEDELKDLGQPEISDESD